MSPKCIPSWSPSETLQLSFIVTIQPPQILDLLPTDLLLCDFPRSGEFRIFPFTIVFFFNFDFTSLCLPYILHLFTNEVLIWCTGEKVVTNKRSTIRSLISTQRVLHPVILLHLMNPSPNLYRPPPQVTYPDSVTGTEVTEEYWTSL